jgi:hypothetical protein
VSRGKLTLLACVAAAVLALPAASAFPDYLVPAVVGQAVGAVEAVPVAGPIIAEECFWTESVRFCTQDADPFLGIEEEEAPPEANVTHEAAPAENATAAPAEEDLPPAPEAVEPEVPPAAPAEPEPGEPLAPGPVAAPWTPSPKAARTEAVQPPKADWGWALAAAAVTVPWALALKLSLLLLRRRDRRSPVRDEVLQAILRRPGIRHRELVLLIGRGNGTVEHHVLRLAREGKVALVRGPRSTSYFGQGTVAPELLRVLPALRRRTALGIAQAVAAAPGVRATEVARRVGVSLPTVSYHVKILAERGVLQAGPAGLLLTKAGTEGLALMAEDAAGALGVPSVTSGSALLAGGPSQPTSA